MGWAGDQEKSVSMLAPGNFRCAAVSVPKATIGAGHSANSFLAAATSVLKLKSGGPTGYVPPATQSRRVLREINSFTPGKSSAFARFVAGPVRTTTQLPSYCDVSAFLISAETS